VRAYLREITATLPPGEAPLVSVIVFGSLVTGGFAGGASDVDLILVVHDAATPQQRAALRTRVAALEAAHDLAEAPDRQRNAVERFARQVTANVRSFFICTRADLLSGDVARLLSISRAQALFVDRIVLPSILGSAATAWGEDLLPRVPVAPIRRVDVLRAFYALWNQLLLTAAMYPLVPDATKYAMGAIKRSVHSCYFCYHLQPAPLGEEVAFLQRRHGRSATLDRLMHLRADYRHSFGFVVRCLPALVRLHLRTALDNAFPRGGTSPS
jgi:hypothetical protein